MYRVLHFQAESDENLQYVFPVDAITHFEVDCTELSITIVFSEIQECNGALKFYFQSYSDLLAIENQYYYLKYVAVDEVK